MPGAGGLAELPVGRRVAYWRLRRNLTQQMLADRLGKSKSWVDKVERGARALDKFSVLDEMAHVLQIDVKHLLGDGPDRRADPDNASRRDSDDIRAALERYVAVTGYLDGALFPPQLPVLRKAVNHAWLGYQHGDYATLRRNLPDLLRQAQSGDAYYRHGDDATEAAHLLAQLYQISSSVLRKTGEHDLAWLAADRATATSMRAGDSLLTGVAATRAGSALLALDRPRAALELHLSVANRLAPSGTNSADPDVLGGAPCYAENDNKGPLLTSGADRAESGRLSVYGALLLQGAMAAARLGDNRTVRDLLREAGAAAARLGSDQNHYWTSFGPTNVRLHRVAADVELGEGRRAVDVHRRIDPGRLAALLPERRAQHLLDVARACVQVGEVTDAGRVLLECERLAPSEVLDRPAAREVVTDIVRRSKGKPPASIGDLAQRMRSHSAC